jgi:tungstate transport system substrate-binding protein
MKRSGFLARAVLASALVIAALALGAAICAAQEKVLMMATTTSTDNTGLLNYLAPALKAETGIDLRWTAVGTGKALQLGQNCDVSVLLVHDPEAEEVFIQKGYGVDRTRIMFNDYVFIGPAGDPAGIKGKPVSDALALIARAGSNFASRGDNSGTHMAEVKLWKNAGLPVPDKETWYISAGQGMLNTIAIAAERNGYTLTDRGTYIKYEENMKGNPPLVILVEGDASLRNQYSVIAVNPKNCPNANYALAKEFTRWMVSPKTLKFIADFKMSGKQLFFPNADEK